MKLYSGKVCDLQLASEEEDIAGSYDIIIREVMNKSVVVPT